MPSHLRSRTSPTKAAALLVADLLDSLAKRLVHCSREVERELLAFAQSTAVLPAAKRSSHVSAEHCGVAHRHDLLCDAPARAATKMYRLARLLRLLDAKPTAEPSSLLRLPVGRLRCKAPRPVECTDVPRTIELLAQWAHKNGVAPAGRPVWTFAFPYPEDCTLPPERRRAESVCRLLYGLTINLDNPLIGSARVLAQEAFDAAGELSAIVGCIAKLNADFVELRRADDVVYFQALPGARDLLVARRFASLMNRLLTIGVDLYDLDENIRLGCLPAPHDHEPRGRRPEPRQWLSVIEDLSLSGFENDEIAELVDDGEGGDRAQRTKRVTRYLNRRKGNPRGTVYVTGRPVPSAHSQAPG